ncbi:sodium/glucose cotransporter 4-like isoform X1 [Saccostrea cucullata]|uniref:sodium/glucose cotransporter 4-like isoform X1 n=1 Tax=Saccostrea cuccullata TaxID=36930 RepID=UPI002ED133C3
MSTKGLDHWGDILVVVIYFCLILGIGIWSLCRPNRGNVNQYFLAGRSMPWFAVGASIFSSNIGSEHFVGLAGAGASSGIVLVFYEWFVIFEILACAWVFLPVYISAGVFTLPEYLHRRHGRGRIRVYLSSLALVLYILSKLVVSIFSGSMFIQMALASIIALLLITGVFTVLGGLRAVMYTDTFQTAVMMIGAVIVTGYGFEEVGGFSNLQAKYMNAIPSVRNENTSCGLPKADAFHLFLDPVNSDYPWPAILVMSTLGASWYWCCDQMIVQRSLAAKNLSHAKGGSIMTGYIKLLPMFLLVFPGMISRVLYPDDVACTEPSVCEKVCDNSAGCSNIAYPKLVLELLPYGLRGLLMVVMFSAVMSSLTSIFNSSSTIFTMDIWRRIRREATQRELLLVGRVFVVFMCGVSVLWVPIIKSSAGGQLFTYMTAVEGYIAAPLGVVFLLSIFWTKTTEPAAFFGLIIANIIGGIRLVLEFVYPTPSCGEMDQRPTILKMNYLYFGVMLLFITACIIVGVSMFTSRRSLDELEGVTWWTRYSQEKPGEISLDNQSEADFETKENGPRQGMQKEDGEVEDKTVCQKILTFLFGHTDVHQIEEFLVQKRRQFLHQGRKSKILLNVNAIVLMLVIAFLTGFFH